MSVGIIAFVTYQLKFRNTISDKETQTPCSWVVLEKFVVAQLFKKLLASSGANHCALSWDTNPTHSQIISLRSLIIGAPFTPRSLKFSSLMIFPTQNFIRISYLPCVLTLFFPPHLPWFTNYEAHHVFLRAFCYFLLFRSTCSQHLVPKRLKLYFTVSEGRWQRDYIALPPAMPNIFAALKILHLTLNLFFSRVVTVTGWYPKSVPYTAGIFWFVLRSEHGSSHLLILPLQLWQVPAEAPSSEAVCWREISVNFAIVIYLSY